MIIFLKKYAKSLDSKLFFTINSMTRNNFPNYLELKNKLKSVDQLFYFLWAHSVTENKIIYNSTFKNKKYLIILNCKKAKYLVGTLQVKIIFNNHLSLAFYRFKNKLKSFLIYLKKHFSKNSPSISP